MIELLAAAFGDRGVPAEVPLVKWPDIVVLVGDEAVHRHHVVHEYRAQQVLLEVSVRSRPDLAAPGGDWACKKSISGHRAAVRREPLLGGESAPQGQVFRRAVSGEVLELPAEVGLVEIARRLSE